MLTKGLPTYWSKIMAPYTNAPFEFGIVFFGLFSGCRVAHHEPQCDSFFGKQIPKRDEKRSAIVCKPTLRDYYETHLEYSDESLTWFCAMGRADKRASVLGLPIRRRISG